MPEYDFVHTRLIHSLEVSCVACSLGKRIGEDIINRNKELLEGKFTNFDFSAIVAAAALAHDLGNPPFGHAGEEAISAFFIDHPELKGDMNDASWADFTHFEGNAQGFRILNQKEYGFSLTAATIGAFSKYPCPSPFESRNKNRQSQKKYGYFQSEKTQFAELAGELNLSSSIPDIWHRHPLSFLVEAADDICYTLIDLEDGCRLGIVSYEDTLELFTPILGEKLDRKKLNNQLGINSKLGILRAMSIGQLVEACFIFGS